MALGAFPGGRCPLCYGLDCVRVGEWVLCLLPDGWYASRPQPCPGRFFRVMSLRDIPAASLTPDHFRWPPPSSFLMLRIAEPPTYDLVGRASPAEIAALTSRFRHSRPGPSGWKLCFIEAFPCAFQTAFWHAVDLQRLTGVVSATFLRADQLHLSKPSGGWRPLSMIEEHVKALEAPVVERLALSRAGWSPDAPFSVLNRAYTKGMAAAAKVLYLDSLVCEDARRHNRPLLRIPADYEKFFNTLNLPQIDAAQQGRGIPDAVRRLHCSLFSKLRVTLDTRTGPWRLPGEYRKGQSRRLNFLVQPKTPCSAYVHATELPTPRVLAGVSLPPAMSMT